MHIPYNLAPKMYLQTHMCKETYKDIHVYRYENG